MSDRSRPDTLSHWREPATGRAFVVLSLAEMAGDGTPLVLFRESPITGGHCPMLACPTEEFLTRYEFVPKNQPAATVPPPPANPAPF